MGLNPAVGVILQASFSEGPCSIAHTDSRDRPTDFPVGALWA